MLRSPFDGERRLISEITASFVVGSANAARNPRVGRQRLRLVDQRADRARIGGCGLAVAIENLVEIRRRHGRITHCAEKHGIRR